MLLADTPLSKCPYLPPATAVLRNYATCEPRALRCVATRRDGGSGSTAGAHRIHFAEHHGDAVRARSRGPGGRGLILLPLSRRGVESSEDWKLHPAGRGEDRGAASGPGGGAEGKVSATAGR